MSEYKSIKGKTVQSLGTDPSETSTEGQVWYNSTAGAFKSLLALEAWSSGSSMISPQRDGGYGQSTPSTASWAAGGTSSTRNIVTTQEYNGSGWSSGGNLNTGREEGTGFGLVSASVLAGGATYPPALLKNEVEEYDGSTWTAGTALPASRKKAAGAGTQTTGLVSFGSVDPPSTTGSINATTLEYDGTSWTAGGTGNTARYQISGCGTQTAALAFGGNDPSYSGATEEYDGSTWTTSGAMNTARSLMGGSGIQTSALAYAGFTPYSVKTENYNGTSWSNSPDLSTARDRVQGGGTDSSNAIAAGGLIGTSPYTVNLTEEFNKSVNVITGAAFSSGGTATETSFGRNFSNMGTQNATYMNAGYNGSYKNETEEYNGTSWSGGGSSSNFRYFGTGAGTLTSGLAFGGFLPPPTGATNLTEEYNGSSWTSGGNMNSSAGSRMGGGPQTAAIACGGTGPITATEYYDGSTWTTQPATLNETHRERNGVGTQSSFVAMGGTNPAETVFHTDVEEYNGTSWSSVAELVIESKNAAGIIGQSADSAVYVGGQNSNPATNISNSQVYDGVSVVTGVNPAHSARSGNQGAGTSSAGGLVSGRYPSVDGVTEEFTGETSAINFKTLTTS